MERKLRGFGLEQFSEALENASELTKDPNFKKYCTAEGYKESQRDAGDTWPDLPGSSDSGDPYTALVPPDDVKVWDHVPVDEAEKAIYYGAHKRSPSNPLSLHTHMIGGKLSGAHLHTPGQNTMGAHSHADMGDINITTGVIICGDHAHEVGQNLPSGYHEHRIPSNFG